ncbi:MAG: hypothetical protein CVV42_04860 [Candidatus Riflebacteria bacterium HGW-Riflebacteria-2]|jgi:hypothetical protein|nr:MAG: hypothetical protein CVV42_04860 [Candidatus Riflebacteria bacterium HGW-Riflebacteria-2]
MFCPVCKGEYREGFTECSNCQVNLVADLDNITEHVHGEIKLCVACEIESEPDVKRCPGCGMPLIRAVLHDDTYVFLEKPPENIAETVLVPDVEENLINELAYYTEIPDEEGVILLESEDIALLVKVQEILNKHEICFQFRPATDAPGSLGGIFGGGNILDRSFPKVVVYADDEAEAIKLIATSPELALCEIPPELMESEEDEEGDDDYDDYDDENDESNG